jgi:formylglycine-generating enzyme required for sulfatase activity
MYRSAPERLKKLHPRGDEDDRPYPWGPVWQPDRCSHNKRMDFRYTSPVDACVSGAVDGRSPFGVADMTGNVREWTADGRHPDMRTLRGGGWSDNVVIEGLVSVSIEAAIEYESQATGFRCATDIVYEERPIDADPALPDGA